MTDTAASAVAPRPSSPKHSPGKRPLSPETRQRIETNRLKAKARYEAHLKSGALSNGAGNDTSSTTPQPASSTSTKRPHDAITPRSNTNPPPLRPGRGFDKKYVEYDLSAMTDTKGGFLSTNDDPLSAIDLTGKPEGMSIQKWSAHLLHEKLAKQKQGMYEPPLSILKKGEKDAPTCFDCGRLELDWQFLEVFRCRVCHMCKDKYPEKYSLLTKTEAKADYMITDPELKDTEILPHLDKPNPHKAGWNDMQLFLRYQVEARAIAKFGSLEKMDEEFEKRSEEKKRRKNEKFQKELRTLKNKTRVETWKRTGEVGRRKGRHTHVWGAGVEKAGGVVERTCVECGFVSEEIEL